MNVWTFRDALGREHVRYGFDPIDTFMGGSPQLQAERLGVDYRALLLWRKNGMNEKRAERCALALGLDPYCLWPEMLDRAITEQERECAAPDCTVRFIPPKNVPWKKWCHPRCGHRTLMRARYERDRERIIARAAAWNEANRDTKRKYNRSYYRRNREALLAASKRRYEARRRQAA